MSGRNIRATGTIKRPLIRTAEELGIGQYFVEGSRTIFELGKIPPALAAELRCPKSIKQRPKKCLKRKAAI